MLKKLFKHIHKRHYDETDLIKKSVNLCLEHQPSKSLVAAVEALEASLKDKKSNDEVSNLEQQVRATYNLQKFAVAGVCDQTICYYSGPENSWTTKHSEVVLFDTIEPAINIIELDGGQTWVETVDNIDEFRARPDTW